MAGEFVRTPKQGVKKGRYRARAELPLLETCLALLSFASVVASIQTGHYFATPFAMLFTVGYGYVAILVVQRAGHAPPRGACHAGQHGQRAPQRARDGAGRDGDRSGRLRSRELCTPRV